ncbi:uncharacterized protein [Nicotiana tomentosiformis]|uniref:uncharacterized protein n=1 Tax=Nicotiana tomentosiformis TaxID=4098 RepID=UPI00388CCEA3
MNDEEQKRLEIFERLCPPSFSGTESDDAQDFLDRCQRMLRTASILETSGVSSTTFQLTGEAFIWWETYEMSRPVELARHAVWLVPAEKENIRRFINGLNYQFRFVMTLGNVAGAKFDEVVDNARQLKMVCTQEREKRAAKTSCGPGNSSGVPSGGKSYHSTGRPYRPTQMAHPAHRGASASHGSSGSYSGSRGPPHNLPLFFQRDYYECGELGHVRKYCPCLSRGLIQYRSQATTPAPVISPPAEPA